MEGCDTLNQGQWNLTKTATIDENSCIYTGTKSVVMNCKRTGGVECNPVTVVKMELELSCADGVITASVEITSPQRDSEGLPCVLITGFDLAYCDGVGIQELHELRITYFYPGERLYCLHTSAEVVIHLPVCSDCG